MSEPVISKFYWRYTNFSIRIFSKLQISSLIFFSLDYNCKLLSDWTWNSNINSPDLTAHSFSFWSMPLSSGWERNKVLPFFFGEWFVWWIDNRHVSRRSTEWVGEESWRPLGMTKMNLSKKWQTLFVSPEHIFLSHHSPPTRIPLRRQAVWKILPWLISYKIDTIVTQIPKKIRFRETFPPISPDPFISCHVA